MKNMKFQGNSVPKPKQKKKIIPPGYEKFTIYI